MVPDFDRMSVTGRFPQELKHLESERMLSWDEVYQLTEMLAKVIKRDYKPDVVVSIATGGLVPAKLLKEMLGVKVMGVISARFYNKKVRTEKCIVEPVLSGFVPKHTDYKVLVVDDIVETGTTFHEVMKVLPEMLGLGEWKIKTATLLKKPGAKFEPDYYASEAGEWVVFPWEAEEVSV
ncbi:MAG: phosphoribosyltransferase [Candidatus Aenigmarchaeota archaeon]|nr:phosphoribosyltransferase [Candidatus Aenigmarchaeota archaeon]